MLAKLIYNFTMEHIWFISRGNNNVQGGVDKKQCVQEALHMDMALRKKHRQ